MKKQLLFVTYQNEDFDEGLSYAIDLATAMNEDLTILIACAKNVLEKFNDLMTAITFAEAGEHDTAREILAEKTGIKSESKLNIMLERCRDAGVAARVYAAPLDAHSAIKDFLKHKNYVDMVLLSPSITDNGNISSNELKKLVRTASRPIVTMAKQFSAA